MPYIDYSCSMTPVQMHQSTCLMQLFLLDTFYFIWQCSRLHLTFFSATDEKKHIFVQTFYLDLWISVSSSYIHIDFSDTSHFICTPWLSSSWKENFPGPKVQDVLSAKSSRWSNISSCKIIYSGSICSSGSRRWALHSSLPSSLGVL